MDSALIVHRLHFAFTVTFHYLFPQLTMGLAPLYRGAQNSRAETERSLPITRLHAFGPRFRRSILCWAL